MKLPDMAFAITNWTEVPRVEYAGETGMAYWQSFIMGDLRVRMVEYSPGYLADHWCDRGHVLLVISGVLECELKDGRRFMLEAGMSYQVSDFGDAAHRSSTATGAKLFIVDRKI